MAGAGARIMTDEAKASILKRTNSANPMAEARGLRAEDFGQIAASGLVTKL